MTESELREAKRTIVADCLHREFEAQATDILRKEPTLTAIDQKLDPMIRKYFHDLQRVYEYYTENPEKELEFDNQYYNCEKVGLICFILQEEFIKTIRDILKKAKSLEDADRQIQTPFEELLRQKAAVRKYYGISEDTP